MWTTLVKEWNRLKVREVYSGFILRKAMNAFSELQMKDEIKECVDVMMKKLALKTKTCQEHATNLNNAVRNLRVAFKDDLRTLRDALQLINVATGFITKNPEEFIPSDVYDSFNNKGLIELLLGEFEAAKASFSKALNA